MKTPILQEINILRQQGKTFQAIADMYGCSRQYIHQLVNSKPKKMKAPTKQQLYEQIAKLEGLNLKLTEERSREKEKRWKELLPQAYEVCRGQLKAIFPNLLTKLRFEHVDEGGYWFTFQLVNDSRVQTYAVRHLELLDALKTL